MLTEDTVREMWLNYRNEAILKHGPEMAEYMITVQCEMAFVGGLKAGSEMVAELVLEGEKK